MKNKFFPFKKNEPIWSKTEYLKELSLFQKIYESRPIDKNIHGMNFPHMFGLYFILKKIKPKLIIESGVFRGQSTWLIEKTCPKSKIISIDINLTQRKYISKKVKYSNIDFKFHDFSNIHENTLVFFDDHQNHYERLKQCKWFGIKNIVFEDNYPPHRGDFYTLRHSLHQVGFNHKLTVKNLIKTTYLFMKMLLKKLFNKNYYINLSQIISRLRDVSPNKIDFKNLKKNIKIYFEFPPLININKNKWGDTTHHRFYKYKKPILDDKNIKHFDLPLDELESYNSLTYIRLIN